VVYYASLVNELLSKNRKNEEFILQGNREQMHLAANVPRGPVGPYTNPLNIEVTENENSVIHSHRQQDLAKSDQFITMENVKKWI